MKKSNVGRKKLPASEKRSHPVIMRFRAADMDAIERKAVESRLPVATWAARAVLDEASR